jgi:hypothetical protein
MRPHRVYRLTAVWQHSSTLVIWMPASQKFKVNLLMAFRFKRVWPYLALIAVVCIFASLAQGQQRSPESPALESTDPPPSNQPGSVNGTVLDPSGAVVTGAQVNILRGDRDLSPGALSGTDGEFFFPNVPPGDFQLTIKASGFALKTFSGSVTPGEVQTLPPVVMEVASAVTAVNVGLNREEVATEQIKLEEQQRILGIVPNFYVSYIPNAAPLTPKQKFKLAARSVIDPVTFLIVGASAGVEQAQNHFIEYGQGAEGYAKRYGANYADTVSATFLGGAIFPSILKQDPRYFYKGTGSTGSRALYAIGMSVILKGDNGRWQPGYSTILGSLAAGGISNIYYPSADRNGLELTFENAAVTIVGNALTNLLQEFVIRKLTPKVPNRN